MSNKDEGIFQCQVQRTMNAHEARSERVHLTLIGMFRYSRQTSSSYFIDLLLFSFLLASPNGQPTFLLPNMPLKQGQSANLTCLSSPSKPASKLILYKNEQMITQESSLMISYELDEQTKKNLTKLIYHIKDPDSTWQNARLRCEQIYPYTADVHRDVSTRIQVHCEFFNNEILSFRDNLLIDLDKPKARIESQNRQPLTVNSTATFRCIVHGNPEPSFR